MKYEYLLKKNIKIYPKVKYNQFYVEIDRNGIIIKSGRLYSTKAINNAINRAVDYEYNRQMIIKEYEGAIDKRMQSIADKTNNELNLVNKIITEYFKDKI